MEKSIKEKFSKKCRRDSGSKKSKAKEVVAAINNQEVVVVSCRKMDDNTDEEHMMVDKESLQNAFVIKNMEISSSENLASFDNASDTHAAYKRKQKSNSLTNNITVFENKKADEMHDSIEVEKAISLEEFEAAKLKLESDEYATEDTGCSKFVGKIHRGIFDFFKTHKRFFKRFFIVVFVLGYIAYFAYALWLSKPGISSLIGITIIACIIIVLLFISRVFGKKLDAVICSPLRKLSKRKGCIYVNWALYAIVILTVLAFIIIDIGFDTKRLTSLGGMVTFLFLGFITSKYPSKQNVSDDKVTTSYSSI
ncbi:hypothetical protein HELRODRAFT_170265 [Helobdella robusta]|uniref:Uncharacterized protein n=1 Tax=Helobdella robusta TaxID=6412 RepID=T1F2U8_HELRO|nr:hypothetical protein HELRODRAFT_170265 [Helobdella robusta]ESO07722.1 hypothetical protein HELRODRAFT_170265 [Helobdella robusta]